MTAAAAVTWGDGIKVEVIALSSMKPNPWNPNKMSEETFAKEILSIKNNGFIEPIKVRVLPNNTYEIVDGEHRWRAAQSLGMVSVPVVNLGKIPDEKAKKLTIIANELRGAPEPVLLAALIKDLNATVSLDDLALELPMSSTELDSLIKSTTAFDWDAVESSLATEPIRPTEAPANLGGERRFQLGIAKGSIPTRLCDELTSEFNRSAAAIGSTNPELVLRHWLKRLQGTAEAADQEAVQTATNTPPQPARRSKKAAVSS